MKRELSWNTYSIAIILLFTIFQIIQWPLLPKFIDIYYHLCAMLGLNEAGGFTTKAFWEYAPVGRPYIYPPLLHILMLIFYKIGSSPIFIARLFDGLIYPLSLLVIWITIKKIFNPRLSFFIVLIYSSIYPLYLATINFIPFTLALLFGLLVFLCIEKNKILSAGILLGLSFYTHSLMSQFTLVTILIYGLLNRERLKKILIVCIYGIILGLPFLLYQFNKRQYFRFIDVRWNYFFEINIIVFILGLIGIFYALRKNKAYLIFLSLFIGMLPFLFTHRVRFISGHGLIGPILLSGIVIDILYERIRRPLTFLFFLVCILYFVNPSIFIDIDKKIVKLNIFNSTLTNLMPSWKRYTYGNENTIYYPKFFNPIAETIQKNSHKNEIIWSDISYAAALLSVLSDRVTASSMLQEIKPYYDLDPLRVSKIIIWLKEPEGEFPQALPEVIKKYNLKKIEETALAYIYLNPDVTAKKEVSKPVIPTSAIFIILFVCMGLIVFDLKVKKEPE